MVLRQEPAAEAQRLELDDGRQRKRVQPAELALPVEEFRQNWWAMQDSNLRPTPCKGDALATTLIAQRHRAR